MRIYGAQATTFTNKEGYILDLYIGFNQGLDILDFHLRVKLEVVELAFFGEN